MDSLLDVSRIASGRLALRLEQVNLAGVVREMMERFADDFERAGCVPSFQGPDEVVGMWDRLRLEQLVANLLSNAVKFTHEGRITIRLQEQHDRFVISVQDSGIGIAPEELTRIFEPFYQAENFLTRHHRGTGLGLPLARRMVELMGGKLDVDAIQGTGSTFTVTLPHTPPDAQHTES